MGSSVAASGVYPSSELLEDKRTHFPVSVVGKILSGLSWALYLSVSDVQKPYRQGLVLGQCLP